MKKIRRFTVGILTVLFSFIFVPVVAAHPLGNFTINHYAGLNVSREVITVDFVLDMAEIPAFQEINTFDANGNGQPDPSETALYYPAKCESIRSDLDLRVNNHPVVLKLTSSDISFPAGAGGLLTLRLSCNFTAPVTGQATQIAYTDNSYAERIGWREIVVSNEGVSLTGDLISYRQSVSNRLTAYPKDMLSNPLNQRTISFGVDMATSAQSSQAVTQQTAALLNANRNDAFTQLITLKDMSLSTVLFAVLISFVWGAMHALTPGHGKTIVGAYLVGSRGTARHALYLGLTTTITHTLGVFALGFITYLASEFIVPEQLYPWLSFLSGLFVVVLGLNMCITRLREARKFQPVQSRQYSIHVHQHDDYVHPHDHHPHDHDHHEGHTHSHMPPGADGSPVTWRSILALGISGGILPCPSALIVLLSAIALGRIGFGLLLVVAFSVGLAGVLSAIGILFVYAGRLFQFSSKQSWLFRLLPAASALIITLAGLGITARALIQIGWIRL